MKQMKQEQGSNVVHMSDKVLKQNIAGIIEGTEKARGSAASIARALVSKELPVSVLQDTLYNMYGEGDERRAAVMQAIRVALSRITGLVKTDKDGKPVLDKDGNKVLESPKMTLSSKNDKRDDKTLNFIPAQTLTKTRATDTSGKASTGAIGAAVQGVLDALPSNTAEGAQIDYSVWVAGLGKSVAKFCDTAPLAERELLAKELIRILTMDGKLWIKVPEVGQTKPAGKGRGKKAQEPAPVQHIAG